MPITLTVEADQLEAMKAALPATGCKLLRVRPRTGRASDGTLVRNVQIELPRMWMGSMSTALYSLPGVGMMSGQGKLPVLLRWFAELGWYLRPSSV